MSVYRAAALSVLAHFAFLGAVYAISRAPRQEAPNFVVQAPLGEVFVSAEKETGQNWPVQPLEAQGPEKSSAEAAPRPDLDANAPGSAAGVPDGEARPLGEIHPVYPPMSRKLREEGEAVFWIDVTSSGAVSAVRLDRTSGHSRLDEAAAEALRGARFQPAMRGGAGIASTRRFHIEFRLSR
jgi:protein TonB